MEGCFACDLAGGRLELPGGRIHETAEWLVEHCVGPLGVGTLLVKPKRHVVHPWELNDGEAGELGPLLREVASTIAELTRPDQVYVSLWSHKGGVPVHIHFVVQPVTPAVMDEHDGLHGPTLQHVMFERNSELDLTEVESFANAARAVLATKQLPPRPPPPGAAATALR